MPPNIKMNSLFPRVSQFLRWAGLGMARWFLLPLCPACRSPLAMPLDWRSPPWQKPTVDDTPWRATNGSGQATSTAELLVTGRQEGPAHPLKHAQKATPGSGVGLVHQELVSTSSWNPEKGLTGGCTDSRKLFVLSQKVAENYFLYACIKHPKKYTKEMLKIVFLSKEKGLSSSVCTC